MLPLKVEGILVLTVDLLQETQLISPSIVFVFKKMTLFYLVMKSMKVTMLVLI